jgi:hypothetical protein
VRARVVETRARRPKRRVPAGITAIAEELDDVIGRSRQYDNLRHEPIRTRIGGISYEIDGSVEDVLFSQKGDEIGLLVTWCPVDQRGGDRIASWWPPRTVQYAQGSQTISFYSYDASPHPTEELTRSASIGNRSARPLACRVPPW